MDDALVHAGSHDPTYLRSFVCMSYTLSSTGIAFYLGSCMQIPWISFLLFPHEVFLSLILLLCTTLGDIHKNECIPYPSKVELCANDNIFGGKKICIPDMFISMFQSESASMHSGCQMYPSIPQNGKWDSESICISGGYHS
jgi:hypothetical protein